MAIMPNRFFKIQQTISETKCDINLCSNSRGLCASTIQPIPKIIKAGTIYTNRNRIKDVERNFRQLFPPTFGLGNLKRRNRFDFSQTVVILRSAAQQLIKIMLLSRNVKIGKKVENPGLRSHVSVPQETGDTFDYF